MMTYLFKNESSLVICHSIVEIQIVFMYNRDEYKHILQMKKIAFILGIACSSFLGLQSQPYHYNRVEYMEEWKVIDSLENQAGLPKSALAAVEKLLKRAVKEDNPSQQIKALLYKMRLGASLSDTDRSKMLKEFEEVYQESSFPVKPVLASMLGELYRGFYVQRSGEDIAFNGDSGDDPEYWSKKKLTDTARQYYNVSIASDELKKVLLSDFKSLKHHDNNADGVWTTMYDFLINRVLEFETEELNEQVRSRVIEDERCFGDEKVFLGLDMNTVKLGQAGRVLSLYQDWIRFHIQKGNDTAHLQANLDRLETVHRFARTAQRTDLYKKALENLAASFDSELKAEVDFRLARLLYNEGHNYTATYKDTDAADKWLWKEAMEICEKAISKWPKSFGARQCGWLKAEINRKTLGMELPEIQYPGEDFLAKLNYRNIDKVYFRMVQIPQFYKEEAYSYQKGYLKLLLEQPVIHSFSHVLPDEGDYHEHSTEFRVPATEPGRYVLIASVSKQFLPDNITSTAECKVSALAALTGSYTGLETYVVDRNSGMPLENVEVHVYESRKHKRKDIKVLYTDEKGFASFDRESSRWASAYYVMGKDTLNHNYNYYFGRGKQQNEKTAKSLLFTDRSIYRPGQELFFKAIALWNHGKGETSLHQHKNVKLSFYDTNNQLVEEKELRTNEFGSVHGSFQIPDNGLTGRMYLRIDHGSFSKTVQVEAYKRPKFELSFDPVTESYRPGDKLTISGKAEALAGSALDGASYKYRIVRTVSFPYGCYFWRPYYREDEEIAFGEGVLNEAGRFDINFKALPMDGMDDKERPEYQYRVMVDVTDLNGETQSDETSISVGEIAMRVNLEVTQILDRREKMDFPIKAFNLNGQAIDTKGKVTVSRLEDNTVYLRNRNWSLPDQYMMSKSDYSEYFPDDPYRDEHLPQHRKIAEEVYAGKFDTKEKTSVYRLKTNWPVGDYRINFEAIDPFGEKVNKEYHFSIIDRKKERCLQKHLCVTIQKMEACNRGKQLCIIWDLQ